MCPPRARCGSAARDSRPGCGAGADCERTLASRLRRRDRFFPGWLNHVFTRTCVHTAQMLRPVPPKRPKAPERAPSVGSATRSRQKNGLGASSYTASSLCGRGAGGTHLPVLVEVPVRHHVVVLHHRGHPKSSLTSAGRSGILCVHATQVWIDESVVVFIIAHTSVPASPCPPRPTGPKRERVDRGLVGADARGSGARDAVCVGGL